MNSSTPLESIWNHFAALRKTVIQILFIIGFGFSAMLFFHQPIFRFLAESINQTPPFESLNEFRIEKLPVILGPLDGVTIVCKVSLWVAIFGTAPLWGWALFRFLSPGLHQIERALYLFFFLSSIIGIAVAVIFAWCITIPITNRYLYFFNQEIGQNFWTLYQYIDYLLIMLLGHAVAAEAILLLFFLVHKKILSYEWMKSKRRIMIVLAFIMGALLSPPDILSQIILALPLVIGFEIAIIYSRFRDSMYRTK